MTLNRALGEFLRSRRRRLEPDRIAAAIRRPRRTAGLKREELAQRAGISTEWYVKLEQGRAIHPSSETVEALGRALRLDPIEFAHLRTLAGADGRPPFRPGQVPDALCRLVAGLPEPAYLTGPCFDVLAWNEAAATLFGDFGRLALDQRNVLHWMLTDAHAKQVFGDLWAEEARRVVALFRATHDLWPGEPAFAALVTRVRARSPEFDGWWSEHGIGAPRSGTKSLRHPTLGVVRYNHASFQANDDPGFKLTLYTRETTPGPPPMS